MLTSARAQAVESVDSLRRLIADLRPPALEELGIAAALEMLGQQDAEHQIEVTVSGIERRIAEPQELTLFRVAQRRFAMRGGTESRAGLCSTSRLSLMKYASW